MSRTGIAITNAYAGALKSLRTAFVYVHSTARNVPEELLDELRIRGASIVTAEEAVYCPRMTFIFGQLTAAERATFNSIFPGGSANYLSSATEVYDYVNTCDLQAGILEYHGRTPHGNMPLSDATMLALGTTDRPEGSYLRNVVCEVSACVRSKRWAHSGAKFPHEVINLSNEGVANGGNGAITGWSWGVKGSANSFAISGAGEFDNGEGMIIDQPDIDLCAPELYFSYHTTPRLSIDDMMRIPAGYVPHQFYPPSQQCIAATMASMSINKHHGDVVTAFGQVYTGLFPSFAQAFPVAAAVVAQATPTPTVVAQTTPTRTIASPSVKMDYLAFFSNGATSALPATTTTSGGQLASAWTRAPERPAVSHTEGSRRHIIHLWKQMNSGRKNRKDSDQPPLPPNPTHCVRVSSPLAQHVYPIPEEEFFDCPSPPTIWYDAISYNAPPTTTLDSATAIDGAEAPRRAVSGGKESAIEGSTASASCQLDPLESISINTMPTVPTAADTSTAPTATSPPAPKRAQYRYIYFGLGLGKPSTHSSQPVAPDPAPKLYKGKGLQAGYGTRSKETGWEEEEEKDRKERAAFSALRTRLPS